MSLRGIFAVGGAIAGGALAVTSGAGILMVGASALAGAGAADTVILLGKSVVRAGLKATGQQVPADFQYTADDAVTAASLTAALGMLHTAGPKDMQQDPSTNLLTAFGAAGLGNGAKRVVSAIVAAPDVAAKASAKIKKQF